MRDPFLTCASHGLVVLGLVDQGPGNLVALMDEGLLVASQVLDRADPWCLWALHPEVLSVLLVLYDPFRLDDLYGHENGSSLSCHTGHG